MTINYDQVFNYVFTPYFFPNLLKYAENNSFTTISMFQSLSSPVFLKKIEILNINLT